jgi:hypothetical protein
MNPGHFPNRYGVGSLHDDLKPQPSRTKIKRALSITRGSGCGGGHWRTFLTARERTVTLNRSAMEFAVSATGGGENRLNRVQR